jgi:hypothetical protein
MTVSFFCSDLVHIQSWRGIGGFASLFLLADLLLATNFLLGTRYGTLFLFQNQLNVARAVLVRPDASVRAVSTATLLGRLVNLNVSNLQSIQIKRLLLGVGLSILKQSQQELSGLLWPTTLKKTQQNEITIFLLQKTKNKKT